MGSIKDKTVSRAAGGLVRVEEREIRIRETCQGEVMKQPLCHVEAFGFCP